MERIGTHYCKCGCGQLVTKNENTYMTGHSSRVITYKIFGKYNDIDNPLCACGCGNFVKRDSAHVTKWNKFIKGHSARILRGFHHSEESKENMRKAHIGVHHSAETKKKMSDSHLANPIVGFWKGKHHSKETKAKMRKSVLETYENPEIRKKCGHPQVISQKHRDAVSQFMLNAWQDKSFREKLTGENADGWLGGLSFEPYGKEFNKELRRKIYERDGYKCQNPDCKDPSKKLDAHHIDYNKRNNFESNLISLCCKCHTISNWNREYWTQFYQNIIKTKNNGTNQENRIA